jgi:hypothetical protein
LTQKIYEMDKFQIEIKGIVNFKNRGFGVLVFFFGFSTKFGNSNILSKILIIVLHIMYIEK